MKRLYALIASAILLLIAIVLPPLPFTVKSYDFVFVLDITRSMNVQDYSDKQGALSVA
ncbi:hypothetical protein GCM10025856_12990 [Methylophaga marina]|uniref:hypothetical protein n=1 Tax=Methylophaga marina TaxID=45495 RepID=UPI0025730A36|nr:hypothetical protein [Methylophaga marina]BDZ73580.1 hypothetical protein GCM10025856_12990 [Methylophaga marina]